MGTAIQLGAISELRRYRETCNNIAKMRSVDELKGIRAKAVALQAYAHEAQNHEAESGLAAIRIRAERRAGQLLQEMRQNGQRHNGRGNNRKLKSVSATPKPTLEKLGITKDQSHEWQELAKVPEKVFEEAVEDRRSVPTTAGIIAQSKPPEPKFIPCQDEDALMLWGWMMNFEKVMARREQKEIIAALRDPSMWPEVVRLVPKIARWLEALLAA